MADAENPIKMIKLTCTIEGINREVLCIVLPATSVLQIADIFESAMKVKCMFYTLIPYDVSTTSIDDAANNIVVERLVFVSLHAPPE